MSFSYWFLAITTYVIKNLTSHQDTYLETLKNVQKTTKHIEKPTIYASAFHVF